MTFDGHEAVQQILHRPVRRVHVCADRIWLHDVDRDAARAEIAGQPARYALALSKRFQREPVETDSVEKRSTPQPSIEQGQLSDQLCNRG